MTTDSTSKAIDLTDIADSLRPTSPHLARVIYRQLSTIEFPKSTYCAIEAVGCLVEVPTAQFEEARLRYTELIATPALAPAFIPRANILRWAAEASIALDNTKGTGHQLDEAMRIYTDNHDKHGQASVTLLKAVLAVLDGDYTKALERFARLPRMQESAGRMPSSASPLFTGGSTSFTSALPVLS